MFRSRFVFNPPCQVRHLTSEQSSKVAICAIDDIVAQSFTHNDAGWVRNEFAAALRAQTLEEYKNAITRLSSNAADLSKDKGIPDKLSFDQAIQLVRPRYAQSYTELQQYSDAISSLDFVQEMDADLVAKLNPDVENVDEENVSESESE